jgi:hypothetical protein
MTLLDFWPSLVFLPCDNSTCAADIGYADIGYLGLSNFRGPDSYRDAKCRKRKRLAAREQLVCFELGSSSMSFLGCKFSYTQCWHERETVC